MGISNIELDPRSRDEIPQLLAGLKAIYAGRKTRNKVFSILQNIVSRDFWKSRSVTERRLILDLSAERLAEVMIDWLNSIDGAYSKARENGISLIEPDADVPIFPSNPSLAETARNWD